MVFELKASIGRRELIVLGLGAGALGVVTAVMDTTGALTKALASYVGLWTTGLALVGFLSRDRTEAVIRGLIAASVLVASYYIAYWLLKASLDWDSVIFWVCVSLGAGPVIGVIGVSTRRRDWIGAAATALLAGLLFAEAAHILGLFRRMIHVDLPANSALAFTFDVVAALVIITIFAADWRRRAQAVTLLWLGFIAEFVVVYSLRIFGLE